MGHAKTFEPLVRPRIHYYCCAEADQNKSKQKKRLLLLMAQNTHK